MSCVFLIPAYKPTNELVQLLEHLKRTPKVHIIVVDDGSPDQTIFANPIFQELTLLHHAVNRGKGAALKTGFDYALQNIPNLQGCITIDADGQHAPLDVETLLKNAEINPSSFILGVRNFDASNIPLRSRLGNKISAKIWQLLTGAKLADTQTGLRYLPKDFMMDCLLIGAERYEFEMEMLLLARHQNRSIQQVEIQTIYLEQNASSHFNPIFDSIKIYFSLFRFAISGLLASLIDYVVYISLIYLSSVSIMLAFVIARLISLSINFQINRKAVFNVKAEPGQFIKYLILCGTNMLIGYVLLKYMPWEIHSVASKVIVDALLFVLNFFVQREFIFKEKIAY